MPFLKVPRWFYCLPVLFAFVSCSTAPRTVKKRNSVPLLPGMTANDDKEAEYADEVPEVAELPVIERFDEPTTPENPEEDEEEIEIRPKKKLQNSAIPHEFNENVANWIQYFSQKDRERFQRFLDRGEPYREAVENILEENKVPADLYYLGLIESGFNFRAQSRVKASGVWQFMKPTGKMYGLGVDAYIDERRDPIQATEAAARYLRDLYREFNSWYLAMAAYNAGPGRIRGCIRRAGTDDFWELVQKKKLPRETMEYIPKYLAARYIGENPELFAFYINEEKKYPDVELVKIPSPILFTSIEKIVGMPEGTLAFVNPHYLKNHSHPAKKTDEIWVPEKYSSAVENQFQQLASMKIRVKPVHAAKVLVQREKIVVHIVKKGDTLNSIARKQGLSVAYLRQANHLSKNAKLMPGQRLKLSASSYRQKRSHPRPKLNNLQRKQKN
jgi:membrane-bound lytic murein transglycosylase D